MTANIQRTLASIITYIAAIAALIAESPSELDILPKEMWHWKATILGWAIFIAGASHIWKLVAQNKVNTAVATKVMPLLLAMSFMMAGCSSIPELPPLEGLSKDDRRKIILAREEERHQIVLARESRASIWSTIGSGFAQGLGGAAVGWANSKTLPNSNGLKK